MAALSRQWKISRAERDLEFAKDQSPELIGIAKAQEKHDNTAKAIFAAIEGADDFEMGVGDARAVVDLALSLIKDEDEEYLDMSFPPDEGAPHPRGTRKQNPHETAGAGSLGKISTHFSEIAPRPKRRGFSLGSDVKKNPPNVGFGGLPVRDTLTSRTFVLANQVGVILS